MKKTTHKKVNKEKDLDVVVPETPDEEEETTPAELDPEVMKALNKAPKKSKGSADATDYIAELEGDHEEVSFAGYGSDY